jgi:hypothetical protein
MGRELKRVPLDFKWPLKQVWKGYIIPYRNQKCKACDGTGLNKETKKLYDDWYSFDKVEYIEFENGRRYNNLAWCNHITEVEVKALVEEGRLKDFDNPTPKEVNEWNRKKRRGHDAINRWICVKARAKHLGVYGHCDYCNGEGIFWHNDEIKKLADVWESYDPPEGEGFQLWETTSEGSPSSPVFKTLEELCEWCEKNATVVGIKKVTKEKWLEMLSEDFVVYKEGNVLFL